MKMKMLVMSLGLMVFSTALLAQNTPKSDETCETHKANSKTAFDKIKKNSNLEKLDGAGSNFMDNCVKLTGNNMRYLYKKDKKPNTEIPWDAIVEGTQECQDASKACNTTGTADEQSVKTAKCNEIKNTLIQCDAAAFLISEYDRDWNTSEDVTTKTIRGGDPEIKCTGSGIETLDYEGCVKFIKNSELMDAAQTVAQKAQDLVYQDKAMTAQANAMNSKDTATAGLTVMHDGLKDQQELFTTRAAIVSGKLAALVSTYKKMPTHDEVIDNCNVYKTNDVRIKVDSTKTDYIDPTLKLQECNNAVNNGFDFIANEQQREHMKSKLVAVGGEAVLNGVQAALAADKANKVNSAIANVNSFKVLEQLAPPTDNVTTTFCQQNPGDPKCLTGGLQQTFDATGDNLITFGDGGTGTTYSNTNPTLDGSGGGTNTNAIKNGKAPALGMGSVVSNSQQGNGLADNAAAATVSKGSNSGGGGGGGGSGGGGSGGGGGGGAPAGGGGGGVTSAIQGRAPSYGGGSGTLSMMGGSGINKSKSTAKDDGNPFGKLFNKDANKNGAIDFGRAPASQKVGTKGDNLFDMISKRYTNVNGDKRLIEYEMAK